ncbi:MAG: murein biosynthesis integral membrane protein MurJ [bacterium]
MSEKLIQSTSVIGSMTLLSRISGLLRDVVFAHLLGDRAAADIFFVALRIPNFFRRISGEGAFSAAFVPVFTDYRMHRSEAENARFLQLLIGRFGLALLLAVVVGVLAAPALVALIAPGFLAQPEKFELAVSATRITFPYLFFISLVALSAGMLNTCGRFAAPAATPILLNLCLIGAALLLLSDAGARLPPAPIALSLGVALAGVAQLAFQIPFLRKERLAIRPRVVARADDSVARAAHEGVARVFRLTVPAILGVSVAQINVLVGTLLASFLATGSIAWLYYSDRLMEFPVGVFGIALGTAILPSLSRQRGSDAAFSKTLDWAARWVCLICVPASVGLIVLAAPMIATIYFHGTFTENGVRQAAASLIAFAFGLTAIVLVKIFAPGFYARENTKTPVRIAMISMGANIVLCLALVYPLKHVGLALATSLAAYLNAALLYRALRQERAYRPEPGWGGFALKVCAAAAGMGALLWWSGGDAEAWTTMPVWRRAGALLLQVALGGAFYFAALRMMGLRLGAMWRVAEER